MRASNGKRESALKFLLSKLEVEHNGTQRDIMHEHIKYNAAADTCAQQKVLIRSLQTYLAADISMGKYILEENGILHEQLQRVLEADNDKTRYVDQLRASLFRLLEEIEKKDMLFSESEESYKSMKRMYEGKISELTGALADATAKRRVRKGHMDPAEAEELLTAVLNHIGLHSSKVKRYGMKPELLKEDLEMLKSLESKLNEVDKSCNKYKRQKESLEDEVGSLRHQLNLKLKRIETLEEALAQQTQMTPSGHRDVRSAMNVIANLVSDLDGSPQLDHKDRQALHLNLSAKKDNKTNALIKLSPSGSERGGSDLMTQKASVLDEIARERLNDEEEDKESRENVKLALEVDPDRGLKSTHTRTVLKDFNGTAVRQDKASEKPVISKRKLLSVSSKNGGKRKSMLPATKLLNASFKVPKLHHSS